MAGRPPKPTSLKMLQGTARADRVNDDEPKPTPGVPDCPAWLNNDAKKEWRAIVPELERLGLLTAVDGAALAAYCQAYGDLAWASREIKRVGRVYQTDGPSGTMYRQRPEMAIAREAAAQMKSYLSGFGLDPASRTRLHVAPQGEADPFEAFLKRGRGSSTG